jgi:hypothetical protein
MDASELPELPDAVVRALEDDQVERADGLAFELATVAETGWPHLALLSVGELVAQSPRELRIALHARSGTSANLRRSGRALLHAVVEGSTWTARLEAASLGEHEVEAVELACFSARVAGVTEHSAPYADVVSGITFALTEPDARDRWRATRALLRRL